MEGMLLGPPEYTIPPKRERVDRHRREVEGWCLEGGTKGSESTRHESRRQWLARNCIWVLATCPACGANGHRRVTAAVTLHFFAVALQRGIAIVVPHPPIDFTHPTTVQHLPRIAALAMGHLVRVRVSGFTSHEGQTCCHIAREDTS